MKKQFQRLLFDFISRQIRRSLFNYLAEKGTINLIQIGANDGETYDTVHEIIKQFPVNALLVEPVPFVFEKLERKYKGQIGIRLLQIAITDDENENSRPFYYLKPVDDLPYNSYYSLWGSFHKDHLMKFKDGVEHFDRLFHAEGIACCTINELIDSSGMSEQHLLQIDAEGMDLDILDSLSLDIYHPHIICFEHMHSDKNRIREVLKKFGKAKYSIYSHGFDTYCVSHEVKHFWRPFIIKKIHGKWLEIPGI